MCKEFGLQRDNLLIGVAAALLDTTMFKTRKVLHTLQQMINEKGIEALIEGMVGEDKDVVLETYE